jgi:hypothetical protein
VKSFSTPHYVACQALVGELDVQQGLRQSPGSAVVAAGWLALAFCVDEDRKVDPRDLDHPTSKGPTFNI